MAPLVYLEMVLILVFVNRDTTEATVKKVNNNYFSCTHLFDSAALKLKQKSTVSVRTRACGSVRTRADARGQLVEHDASANVAHIISRRCVNSFIAIFCLSWTKASQTIVFVINSRRALANEFIRYCFELWTKFILQTLYRLKAKGLEKSKEGNYLSKVNQ